MIKRALIISRINPGNGAGNGVYTQSFLRGLAGEGWVVDYYAIEASQRPILHVPNDCLGEGQMRFAGRLRIGSYHFSLSPRHWLRAPLAAVFKCLPRGWRGKLRRQPSNSSLEIPTISLEDRKFIQPAFEKLMLGDMIIANYAFQADFFPESIPHGVVKVIITHDILHKRLKSMGCYDLAMSMLTAEKARWQKADILVAIQEEEAKEMRALCPDKTVVTVPMAIEPVERCAEIEVPGRVLFVGSASSHNVDGINWFLNEVWSSIYEGFPQAELHICGSVCDKIGAVPTGVILHGRVKELSQHYFQASVVIVPLLNGSGLKIKLVEALAHGCAVVSTPVGLQGVEFLANEGSCQCSQSSGEIVKAVLYLLTNLEGRKALRTQAVNACRIHFSEKSLLNEFLRRVNCEFTKINAD